ncbi:DEAD-box ATP-dependent RNA helicase 52C-like [Euphorbia lathyris]|uniref:DEAD-box ATP-dependent RNA helicase 52C-like n=1 Tax=Euphorbia lathyris TaxID=212925 RepID=UPI003313E14F
MTWVDTFTESTRKPTRRTQPSYVPPHFRNFSNAAPFHYRTDSADSASGYAGFSEHCLPSQPGSSRRPRGRGRGRGVSQRRASLLNESVNNKSDYQDSFDLTERFERLEVTKDNETNDNNNENSAINFDAYEDIPVEVTGSNIPAAVNTFSEIDLGEGLNENIKRCNYVRPTPIQRHAIPIAVAGRDLMACAQTGSGKTAAFCFPIIHGILRGQFKTAGSGRGRNRVACPTALILSPTRELSCQIHDEAHKFAYNTGVKIGVVYGGAPILQQFRNLEKGVDVLVATPGRLVDMIERGRVSLGMIKYLALDEADRMLDMGFEPQIRKIVQQMDMPPLAQRQTMLFSATFPHNIQKLASDFLSDYVFLTVGRVGSSTNLIAQRVELVQDMDKRNRLVDILGSQMANGTNSKQNLTLIFVETKRGADALEHWLCTNGFPAIAIHGDKMQKERERALKLFKSGATPILVATDVASRGLDIPHVSHVINFDLPRDIDDYVHRIGRTGRAGKSGAATAFFSDKNSPIAKGLAEVMKEGNLEVPSWLSQYAESSSYGGRTKRYGGSKFGGYDCRSNSNSQSYNMDSYSYGTSVSGGMDSYATPSSDATGYDMVASSGSYAASQGYEFGHESVVASGWD